MVGKLDKFFNIRQEPPKIAVKKSPGLNSIIILDKAFTSSSFFSENILSQHLSKAWSNEKGKLSFNFFEFIIPLSSSFFKVPSFNLLCKSL